jgi:DNA (cytosine-5)-methyltransferase 1
MGYELARDPIIRPMRSLSTGRRKPQCVMPAKRQYAAASTPKSGVRNATAKDPAPAHRLTFMDLFSGCGGFSLGLGWAGLRCLAALDINKSAVETFRANHPPDVKSIVADLTKFRPQDLDRMLGNRNRVDVIVGGPPCQGFSKARQVDGANHGERLVEDLRRDLYKAFLRYVVYFQPSVFVMENVLGIRSAAGGKFFTRVQAESREIGYRIIPFEVRAWRFGVPQKRIRQLLIGTRHELPLFIPDRFIRYTHADPGVVELNGLQPAVTLGEAIGDLPEIDAGDASVKRPYNAATREAHLERYGRRFIYDVLQAHKAEVLTGHSARAHSGRDVRDFMKLREGENSRQALKRGAEMEFPYDRESFKDRYTKQHRDGLCSTIVAHLQKDGLMFIHPNQPRSLTPREAARIQSFPDTFTFPTPVTHCFPQIGNAVPPLVGKAVGLAIAEYLSVSAGGHRVAAKLVATLPSSREQATAMLEEAVVSMFLRPLPQLGKNEFLEVWWAVRYLHPHLHPDAAFDNGDTVSRGIRRFLSFVIEPVYIRSGWPVELVPIALEARRRFDSNLLSEVEYYFSAEVVAKKRDRGYPAHVASSRGV